MERLYHINYESDIGTIHIVTSEKFVERIILFEEEWEEYKKDALIDGGNELGERVKSQLEEYFTHERTQFELPIRLEGTPFQVSVWKALLAIPYGEVRSYKNIAISIENEKAVRAIGQANKANRLPIIIPCHRVIGKNGQMVGYGGLHIDKKLTLLDLEKNKDNKGR